MLLVSACAKKQDPADLVIKGGKIYTMDSSISVVEAVAIKNDRIVATGTDAIIEQFIGQGTKVIELDGRIATPGFIEGHGHLMGIGYNALDLDLLNVRNFDEMVNQVEEAVKKAKPGDWILGRGWHQDKWDVKPDKMIKGFPLHDKLSAASPDNPVFLEHASGHAGFANAKAMEIAGLGQLAKEKLRVEEGEGGEIIRDAAGNPTGLFSERAMSLITDHIPKDSDARNRQALNLAMQACLRNGITSFHDAGATRTAIDLYHAIKKEGTLGLRLYVMITGEDRNLMYEWLKKGPEIDSTGWRTIRSIKLHCDGALGS
ncbi:MAG TPA: amidohydrolase family protein, partial [Chryseolinea sp.]|nr:amidohydrolase family protein [Chryseolinea sp.]